MSALVNTPSTKVELTLSATHLKDTDLLSKSDPCCVVYQYVQSSGRQGWKEIGRTETIMNCLKPEWNTKIYLEYYFEERQRLKFEIYDIDDFRNRHASLDSQDFLGRAECELAEIIASNNGTMVVPLRDIRAPKSRLIVHAEEVDEGQKESLRFHLAGRSLDKKDLFGKSDPFLNFYRINLDGGRQLVYRTEVIKKNLNPEWKPFELSVRQLCQGDKTRDFLIECFDYDNDGGLENELQMMPWREKRRPRNQHFVPQQRPDHDFIGNCRTNVDALINRKVNTLPLWNEKKAAKKGKKYTDSGTLHFVSVQLFRQYTFLEFIYGGLQLDFTVAVDFTASNGVVTDPRSLHFINPHQPNQYEMAIKAVLEICQFYNKSKMFDAYGFGAKIPPTYQVSHLFPLNVSTMNPTVHGVEGVMEAYRICLRNTQIFGPTNFSPVINAVAQKAASYYSQQGDRYQVLLIITDGVITDMQKTLAAIIQASNLALSIIIVGVGNDNFEKMDELDSDNQLLSFNGKTAARDIVQFVPFRNFISGAHMDFSMIQAGLAKEVLAEVPDQVTSYMKSRNIAPKPPQNPTPEQADGIYPNPNQPVFSSETSYDQGSIDTGRFTESVHSSSPYNTPRMSINQQPYPTPYPPQTVGYQQRAAPYPPYPVENTTMQRNSAPYPTDPNRHTSPPPPYDATNVNDINMQFQNKMYIDKSSAPPFNF